MSEPLKPAGPPRGSSIALTSEALRVLAHPLRSRLLTELRSTGPATATTLAQRLATNTGATSYHLRKLASVGLVEETDEGRGRERWWRPTTERHSWTDDVTEDDPDGRASAAWLRSTYLRAFVDRAEQWLAHHDGWPLEWRRAAGSSDFALDLTAGQLDALQRELWAVVLRHRDLADEANRETAVGDPATGEHAVGDSTTGEHAVGDSTTGEHATGEHAVGDSTTGEHAARETASPAGAGRPQRVQIYLHGFPEGEAPR